MKTTKKLILSEKDIEILNDVLWEIEENRIYEELEDKESLDKLKNFFNYENVIKYKVGCITLEQNKIRKRLSNE